MDIKKARLRLLDLEEWKSSNLSEIAILESEIRDTEQEIRDLTFSIWLEEEGQRKDFLPLTGQDLVDMQARVRGKESLSV